MSDISQHGAFVHSFASRLELQEASRIVGDLLHLGIDLPEDLSEKILQMSAALKAESKRVVGHE